MVQRYRKTNQNNNNYLQYIDKLGERLQRAWRTNTGIDSTYKMTEFLQY